ncbi:MAG: FAD-dependent oxidoreductase [Chloroflexi bacterium]|nr:FAD-dependent oxidoreductase [Chloroflexota bacterium]
MEVKNRIVMPAMGTHTGSTDGYVTQKTKDYYEERAKGGAGLIIVEITCVDFPSGKHSPNELSADNDKYLLGLAELAETIKSYGARAALQLHHAGNTAIQAITKSQPVAPSAIARPGGDVPKALTISQINRLVSCYASAAKRARDAGFDGVEVHAGHVHLIAQFLSSAWNKRTDRYGGDLENRARFLLEIMQAIRQVVGRDYPLWCRINAEESGLPDGFTLKEAKELARMLEKAGADAINVSGVTKNLPSYKPYFYPAGWNVDFAREIKGVVSVPVMVTGRISAELAERVLRHKKADLIVMGRALRADPELPNKLAAGKMKDIVPCLSCSVCGDTFRPNNERVCTVNPAIEREGAYRITPAGKKKKVLIVGGGPAGMEAARVAALRGHKVTLFEKGERLGGQLLLATVPPYKDEIARLTGCLVEQMKKAGVKVELKQEISPARLEGEKADVLIIATGAVPSLPQIPGINRGNVVTAADVLSGEIETGERVVILGGGRVGCEIAELLAEKGKMVVVVEMLEKLAPEMTIGQGRQILLGILDQYGVTMLTRVKGEKITDEGLVVSGMDGELRTLPADTIVIAAGYVPDTRLFESLRGKPSETYLIGDCVKARGILEAMDDGARIARQI